MAGRTESLITLYKAGQSGMTMVSARPPITLKPSEYPDLSQIRYRYNVLEIRKPDAAFTNSGLPASAVFYQGGSWSGTIAGVEYALVAVKNSTKVDIYDSTDCAVWVKRSDGTGNLAYGITQLTDATASANGISMAPINDPVLGEVVIISDGTTTLLWQPTAINSERLRLVTAVSSSYKNKPIPLLIQQPAAGPAIINTTQLARTGTTWTAGSGVAGLFSIVAPQVVNDTLEINLAPGGNFSTGNQVGIFCTIPTIPYDIFTACKMEMAQSGGGAYTTIYDPTSPSSGGGPPTIETYADLTINGATVKGMWVVYSVPDTFSNSITKIKFTYKGSTTQFATGVVQIYAIVSGTALNTSAPPPGYPDYAIAYRNSATGVETGVRVLDSATARGSFIWRFYAPAAPGTPDGTSQLPISNYLRATWAVADVAPPPASAFDQFCVYRQDAGSSGYFFVKSSTYTAWAPGTPGAWSYSAGSPLASISDDVDENGLNYERPAPSAYNTVVPGHRCAINLNDRFLVGIVNGYKFSEFKWPMRFGDAVNVDALDRSSGVYRLKGETSKALYAIVDNNTFDRGTDKVAFVTDQTTKMISGVDTFNLMRPSKLSHFGTNSPKSFTTRRDTTFFLDDARRIHATPFHSGIDGKNSDIKDILDGISSTNINKVVAANFDDLVFMFYTPSGGSVNNAAVVIDLISGTLSRDTYTLGVVSAIVNGSRLLAFMSDGTMRRLESPTTGTVTGVSVVSREIGTASDSWTAKRHRIYCDGVATTLNLSWTPYKVGAAGIITDTLSIAPDAGEDRTDRFSGLSKAVRGRSIKLGFSGSVTSGTRFYAWQVESEGRTSEGDV